MSTLKIILSEMHTKITFKNLCTFHSHNRTKTTRNYKDPAVRETFSLNGIFKDLPVTLLQILK